MAAMAARHGPGGTLHSDSPAPSAAAQGQALDADELGAGAGDSGTGASPRGGGSEGPGDSDVCGRVDGASPVLTAAAREFGEAEGGGADGTCAALSHGASAPAAEVAVEGAAVATEETEPLRAPPSQLEPQ